MKPQHLIALEKANEVRLARAAVKRRVTAGEITVTEAMSLEVCGNMPVGELLRTQDRWGPLRVRRFLNVAGISEVKRVGSLTERQRDLIAGLLGEQDRIAA